MLRLDEREPEVGVPPCSRPVFAVALPKIGNVLLLLVGVPERDEFREEASEPSLDDERLVSLPASGADSVFLGDDLAGVAAFFGVGASDGVFFVEVAVVILFGVDGVLFTGVGFFEGVLLAGVGFFDGVLFTGV